MAKQPTFPPPKPDEPDDFTILDGDPIWRRVPHWHFVADENTNSVRVSSAAFEDDDDGDPMSVVLGKDLLANTRQPVEVISAPEHKTYGLASFAAEIARKCNQVIKRTPNSTEPAHANVIGKKTNGVKKQIKNNCIWVIYPPESFDDVKARS